MNALKAKISVTGMLSGVKHFRHEDRLYPFLWCKGDWAGVIRAG